MVHKKSEYMLQFHKMSKELRWQIYTDNVQFRNTRRMDNVADHYWSHQLTDVKCDCEDESSHEEDGPFIMPPAYKLKHKALLNAYNSRNSSSHEIAVQTPNWLQSEIRTTDSAMLSAVNTDPDLNRRVDTGTDPPQSPQGSCHNSLLEPAFRNVDTSAPTSRNCIRTASSGLSASQHTFQTSAPRDPLVSTKPAPSPCASKDVKIRERSSHLQLSATRTNRKLYHEGKKTHFVPYGWNDKQSEIGHKKTHNVCAPDDQVYSSALEALRHRRADVENQLAFEAERRRILRGGKAPVNHSSVWMTEYRDKFRPSSLRPWIAETVGHATHHRPVSHRWS